jgi:Flp pilus assembly protein TadB
VTGLVVLGSVVAGAGVVGLVAGFAGAGTGQGRHRSAISWPPAKPASGRLLVAGLIAVVVVAVTRWPIAGVLAFIASLGLPVIWADLSGRPVAERAEALASWCEMLRDTLLASAGLAQGIVATAPMAPRAIRAEVGALAERVSSGVPLDRCLRAFAEELDEPAADPVVCALLLAASARAQRLGDLLGALAAVTRERVASELRVDAARSSTRSGVRVVVLFTIGFAGLLAVAARSYLAPFGTPTGQLVLGLAGGLDGIGLWLLGRLARPEPSPRLLHPGAADPSGAQR